MYWNEIAIKTTPEKTDDAIDFFNEEGILSLNIDDPNDLKDHQDKISWDYIDESILNKNKNIAFVKAYIDEDEKAEEIKNKGKEKGFDITINKLKSEDWENEWKKYFKPFNVSDNTVIVPAWESYEKKNDEKIILLDSGMAFGTGMHETTKMCIEFIEQYVNEDSTVLDIGCGSGILSICAGLYNAKEITAIDIDDLAVKIAKDNIKLNKMENIISVRQGDLVKDVNSRFDIIIANIVADIIKELLFEIDNFLNKNGIFIASGIISERKKEVENIALQCGFTVLNKKSAGGWSAFVFKKEN